MYPFDHENSPIASKYDIPLLSSLKDINDATYAYKLLHRNIDSEKLSELFGARQVTYHLREPRTYSEEHWGSNYKKFQAILRLIFTYVIPLLHESCKVLSLKCSKKN